MGDCKVGDIRILITDLDDTLAPSKLPIDIEMSNLIHLILNRTDMAVISGASFMKLKAQFADKLGCNTEKLTKLFLLPTNGTSAYLFKNNGWDKLYSEELTRSEKKQVVDAINQAIRKFEFATPKRTFGPQIEDRATQITFSALGQNAPIELKRQWDPDMSKRKLIKRELEKMLPDYTIQIGGTTSLDITKKGRDKAYGIRRLMKVTGYTNKEMCFIGDKLGEGGNDYSVRTLGIKCINVRNVEETKQIMKKFIDDFHR
jgi:HAD superfamily hydrolase (TIGR01484 family)